MIIRALSSVVSLAIHALIAFLMSSSSGGAALEQGSGTDVMVVEQGIGIQAIAKLGEDEMSVEPVDAVSAQASAADTPQEVQPIERNETVSADSSPDTVTPIEQPDRLEPQDTPQDMKPIKQPEVTRPLSEPEELQPLDSQIIASASGPQPEAVEEVEPVDVDQPVPEVNPQVVLPKQVVTQQPVERPKQQVVKQPSPPQVAAVQQESAVAMKESSGQEMKGGDSTAQLAYVGKLRANLERSKVNPGTTFAGTVVVRFTVNAKGELVSRKIVASSGNQFLDDAALASVDRGSPFPPIPRELNRDKMEVSVPFKFSVR